MIDVSTKFATSRTAVAAATLRLLPATLARLERNDLPKPDALIVARWAGTQAAKQTAALIPACHPVPLDFVGIEFTLQREACEIEIKATVKAEYKTGVEMEALTAVSLAALTLYDMLKPVDDTLEIVRVRLLEKTGGLHALTAPGTEKSRYRAAVIVVSDSTAAGTRVDTSGACAVERLTALGFACAPVAVVPDDAERIGHEVARWCEAGVDLIITSGGTGLGPRDVTPAAVRPLLEREAPGISEWLRAYGQRKTPMAALANGIAGVRGGTLIVTLPGSRRGVAESLEALGPCLRHALRMIRGGSHG